MSVRIEDNTVTITQKITKNCGIGLRKMLDDIHRASIPVTPKKTGDLRNRVKKQVLGLKSAISWEVNYAKYQEKKQFKNYTTPGTGPKFAERAVRRVVNKANDYFKL